MATALPMLSRKPVGCRCSFKATISRKPTSPACRNQHLGILALSDHTSHDRETCTVLGLYPRELIVLTVRIAVIRRGNRLDAARHTASLREAPRIRDSCRGIGR